MLVEDKKKMKWPGDLRFRDLKTGKIFRPAFGRGIRYFRKYEQLRLKGKFKNGVWLGVNETRRKISFKITGNAQVRFDRKLAANRRLASYLEHYIWIVRAGNNKIVWLKEGGGYSDEATA